MAINIFDFNVEKESEDFDIDGASFISSRISEPLMRRIQDGREKLMHIEKQGTLSAWLQIVEIFASVVVAITVIGTLGAHVPLRQALKNGFWIYIACSVCLVIWIILSIAERVKKKRALENAQNEALILALTETYQEAKKEFGTPDTAVDIDVLCQRYRMKNGKRKIAHKMYDYGNPCVCFYCQNGDLYFETLSTKITVPMGSIVKVKKIKRNALLPQWNKEETPDSRAYKPFKIKAVNGLLYIKSYYSILIDEDGQEYEILIPDYDMEAVLRASCLTVQESK